MKTETLGCGIEVRDYGNGVFIANKGHELLLIKRSRSNFIETYKPGCGCGGLKLVKSYTLDELEKNKSDCTQRCDYSVCLPDDI